MQVLKRWVDRGQRRVQRCAGSYPFRDPPPRRDTRGRQFDSGPFQRRDWTDPTDAPPACYKPEVQRPLRRFVAGLELAEILPPLSLAFLTPLPAHPTESTNASPPHVA